MKPNIVVPRDWVDDFTTLGAYRGPVPQIENWCPSLAWNELGHLAASSPGRPPEIHVPANVYITSTRSAVSRRTPPDPSTGEEGNQVQRPGVGGRVGLWDAFQP